MSLFRSPTPISPDHRRRKRTPSISSNDSEQDLPQPQRKKRSGATHPRSPSSSIENRRPSPNSASAGAINIDDLFEDLDNYDDDDLPPPIGDRPPPPRPKPSAFAERDEWAGLDSIGGDKGDAGAEELDEIAQKKPKRIIAKVDADRLLGQNGFPALIAQSKNWRFKGKGHEASDLKRLLNLYQLWAHKMFPKGQFADTVERVEKVCRERRMQAALKGFKDAANRRPEDDEVRDAAGEGPAGADDDADPFVAGEASTSHQQQQPGTPPRQRPRPRPSAASNPLFRSPTASTGGAGGGGKDNFELDALIEAEQAAQREQQEAPPARQPMDQDDFDFEALIAAEQEEEARRAAAPALAPAANQEEDFDLEAPAEQAEAAAAKAKAQRTGGSGGYEFDAFGEDDEETWRAMEEMEREAQALNEKQGAEGERAEDGQGQQADADTAKEAPPPPVQEPVDEYADLYDY